MEELTICVQCKHVDTFGNTKPKQWDYFCLASPLPEYTNFITGERRTQTGYKFNHCKNVNIDRHCKLFERK